MNDELGIDLYITPEKPLEYIEVTVKKPDGMSDDEWVTILDELIEETEQDDESAV